MPENNEYNRRRFLQATGTAALTASVAGCSGEDDGTDTEETEGTEGTEGTDTSPTDTEDEGFTGLDSYPYSANETDVESAKQLMEEAGYGPENQFQLSWLQYTSPAWKEMANTIRSRLESAHIEMTISEAGFGGLIEKTGKGDMDAFTLGWIADYPSPQNFLQLVDPENTVYNAEGPTPNGARLFWSEDAKGSTDVRQFMTEQFDRVQNNPDQSDEAQSIRDDAYGNMEEALWESAGLIPIYHRVDESFWYDRLDYNPAGGMGGSRSKENISVNSLEGKDRLDKISATFSALDPIASGNTASGGKIMNMFDAPMNYHNGTTEVRNLLVDDYTISDDLTEYEFTLKEGIQFHQDYGEVTADDMIYSLRRLVESPNSTNTFFPNSVLNIERETDSDGNVVPGSTGVEKTGTYSFKVNLIDSFPFALSVLAYSAFSVIPEGVVGDIEGYDGEMSWEEFSTSDPVGSGPFEFSSWESGNGGKFSADAFADYHGEEPAVDGIDAAIITDTTASFNYFLNENADLSGIPTSKYDPSKVNIEKTENGISTGTYGPLDNDKTVNMSQTASINTFYVGFNMEKVPKAVRQAMAYVINRPQFVDNVFKGRGAGAYHLTPTQIYPGGADTYTSHWKAE